jgi:hypothetical protein
MLLSAEMAAAYCGVSRRSFDDLVKVGTLPKPIPLKGRRGLPFGRKLWHRASLDSVLGKGGVDDWQSREAAWRKRQDRKADAR